MEPLVEQEQRREIVELFSTYKAEWLKEELFDLFMEPSYFPQLQTPNPCVLIGGRGTGKTTTLRCLSYEGQFALGGKRVEEIASWRNYGLYMRINTNRVSAFKGSELSEETWVRLFGHYTNLQLCSLLISFLQWFYERNPAATPPGPRALNLFARSLSLDTPASLSEAEESLKLALVTFEESINNVAGSAPFANLSMLGAPIDALVGSICALSEFEGKQFFFLIDEYENLEDYQQRVFNTLIKHSGSAYTFKVGVRELGFRQHGTLSPDEQLIDPADYTRIDILEKLSNRFEEFAEQVCNGRLKRARAIGLGTAGIRSLFRELTSEDEAILLGVVKEIEPTRTEVGTRKSKPWTGQFLSMSPLEIFVLSKLAEARGVSMEEEISRAVADPRKWKTHYENYKQASLFAIKAGKRGFHKYYTGWRVLCMLAGGNIRYLLQLVDASFLEHFQKGLGLSEPIDPESQTKAAQNIGLKNLRELEGLSKYGAKLTKLVLSLGRIFQILAEHPVGHTPEVSQFEIDVQGLTDQSMLKDANEILTAAVMHLALVRYPGSKLTAPSAIQDYDYALHPIFSAFFNFTHRRKRKMKLHISEISGLVNDPSQSIQRILGQQQRSIKVPLPDQLELFETFYATHK